MELSYVVYTDLNEVLRRKRNEKYIVAFCDEEEIKCIEYTDDVEGTIRCFFIQNKDKMYSYNVKIALVDSLIKGYLNKSISELIDSDILNQRLHSLDDKALKKVLNKIN